MTPQELKNSILQLAIQGKLVEQRPEEGTAESLLRETIIHSSIDGQRVKDKIITEINTDELAFDIPSSWVWIKLGSICTIARGGSPRPIKAFLTDSSDGINWIKIGDTEKNGKYIESTAEKIIPAGVSKSRMVYEGDFLLTNSMSFGRPYILKTRGCIHDGWLVIGKTNIFDQDFLYWMLSSRYAYYQFSDKVSGAVVKNLNSDKVANSVFPIPPLAEQKRIVAKIEELLPLIDRYEKAWCRLEELNKRFPDDMQKSILQMAIQGKLIEQLASDENVDELLLSIKKKREILVQSGKLKKLGKINKTTNIEIEIPGTWRLARFFELISKRVDNRGKTPPHTSVKSDREYIDLLEINAIVPGASIDHRKVEKYINEDTYSSLRGYIEEGDILIATVGSIGKFAMMDSSKSAIAQNIIGIRCFDEINQKYIFYLIQSPYFYESMGSIKMEAVQASIKVPDLMNLCVPIPPFSEQKRIVARIEELLPLCEKLKIVCN